MLNPEFVLLVVYVWGRQWAWNEEFPRGIYESSAAIQGQWGLPWVEDSSSPSSVTSLSPADRANSVAVKDWWGTVWLSKAERILMSCMKPRPGHKASCIKSCIPPRETQLRAFLSLERTPHLHSCFSAEIIHRYKELWETSLPNRNWEKRGASHILSNRFRRQLQPPWQIGNYVHCSTWRGGCGRRQRSKEMVEESQQERRTCLGLWTGDDDFSSLSSFFSSTSVAHRASGLLRCCSRICLQERCGSCPDRRRRREGRPASWRQISSGDKADKYMLTGNQSFLQTSHYQNI